MSIWRKTVRSTFDERNIYTRPMNGGSFGGRGRLVTGSRLSGGKKIRKK